MKILSIDTSSNICSVAVTDNTNLIKEKNLDDTKNHSEKIMPVISETLEDCSLDLKDIDLIVCDKGPGSFTGIRIGVATVMALADSINVKTIGINSLRTLAYNVLLNDKNTTNYICSMIDAKNENIYFELYKIDNENISVEIAAQCENINNLIQNLKSNYNNICFVGDGAFFYKNMISNNISKCSFSEHSSLSAYSLAVAGFDSYNSGTVEDILPLYLRKSQAERAKELQ